MMQQCVCPSVHQVNFVAELTAHGLAGVDLLSHEELLQLPDVHPGLCHVLWVPSLRQVSILGGVLTCRHRVKDT